MKKLKISNEWLRQAVQDEPDDIDITVGGMSSCGNSKHPLGPWHTATPLPLSSQWSERIKQWWRKRRYGCGCEV